MGDRWDGFASATLAAMANAGNSPALRCRPPQLVGTSARGNRMT
jgi:hypothetical protein